MINFLRLLLFFVFLGASCVTWGGNKMIYSKPSVIANNAIAQVAKDLEKRYNLKSAGFGGAIHEEVEELALSFNCYRTLSIDEYRKLLIQCAEYFLDQINSNENLKPYLKNYPFNTQNIHLCIFVRSEEKKRFDVGELSCLAVLNGKIVYYYRDSEYTVDSSKREDYEEAKKIVFSGDNNGEVSL